MIKEAIMKYHNPNSRKNSEKLRKASSIPVAGHWLGHDVAEQQSTGPRMTATALHALSRKGLWGLLFFLLASIAAFLVQDFNLYHAFPEPVLQILGCPPPATLIHLALTGYSFTVVVPVLIRMATGENPAIGWHHLLCRSVFYLFYLVSTTLPENFMAVICIGILLYAVEQVAIWSYIHKHLRGGAVAS